MLLDVLLPVLAIVVFCVFAFWGLERVRARLDEIAERQRQGGQPPKAKLRARASAEDPGRDRGPRSGRRRDSEPEPAGGSKPHIAMTDWGGVFLEHGDMQTVLILLPISDPRAIDSIPEAAPAGAVISTMLVLNRPGPGYLWGSTVRDRLGIAADSVFAVDPDAPIDRAPQTLEQASEAWEPSVQVNRETAARAPGVGGGLQREHLRLDVNDSGSVLATWDASGTPVRVLIGAGIPLLSLAREPHPHELIGSIAPGPKFAQEMHEVAPAILFSAPLRKVTLLADVPPDTVELMSRVWLALDVDVTILRRKQPEPAPDDGSEAAIVVGLDGETDQLRSAQQERTAEEIEREIESLTTVERLAEAEALVELGTTYREQGEPERALEPLRRAVALDPRNHVAAAELGVALSELGRDEEAVAVYDAGVEQGLDILRFNRGNALGRLGRRGAAVDDYVFCLEVAPKWWNVRVNLISTLQSLGRLDEAEAQLHDLEHSDAPDELIDALWQQQRDERGAAMHE